MSKGQSYKHSLLEIAFDMAIAYSNQYGNCILVHGSINDKTVVHQENVQLDPY